MTAYVCGFAFNHGQHRVLLTERKLAILTEPGQLDGIIAQVNVGQGFRDAVSKAVYEQAGIFEPGDRWQGFHNMRMPDGGTMYFFATTMHDSKFGSHDKYVYAENTEIVATSAMAHTMRKQRGGMDLMPHLAYILPMAVEAERARTYDFED